MEQAAGEDAVGAALVLLDLLEGNAQRPGQGFLAEAHGKTAQAQPRADSDIDGIGGGNGSGLDVCHSLDLFAYCCSTQRRWVAMRSEEHTSELQSLMRISYAVFCLKKKNKQ